MKKNKIITLPDFCKEILEILQAGYPPKVTMEALSHYHEKDIALALSCLTKEECQRLFRVLPIQQCGASGIPDQAGACRTS